ncbi:MAG: hypothetical protein U5M23_13510 [Marinagarivorans sp.]|nr:hypothetical protein [Marinagarivorans sp.]
MIADAEGMVLSGTVSLPETEYGAPTPSTLVLHASNANGDTSSALKYQWAVVSDTLSLKDLGLSTAALTTETLAIKAPSLIESVNLAVSLMVIEDREGGQTSKVESLTVKIDANNDAPIAIAGYLLEGSVTEAESLAVQVGQVLNLDGSLSRDGDDGIASFTWSIVDADGTEAAFSASPVGVARSLTIPSAPAGANITLRLTVTDQAGQATAANLVLLVDPSDNALPVASAVVITNPVNEGSEGNVIRSTSTDDTGIASYQWSSQRSGY